MGKIKSQLRHGMWPEAAAPAHHPAELTVAAKRLAASVLEELARLGVGVWLDGAGKARFRITRATPPAARLLIETRGDLVESFLIEQAIAALKLESAR